MQTLCQLQSDHPSRVDACLAAWGWSRQWGWVVLGVFAGCLLGISQLARAQVSTQVMPQLVPASPQSIAAQEAMQEQVANWLLKTQTLARTDYDFVPLDKRIAVQPCDKPLVVDLPFSSRETVRVRCLGGNTWQMYLRTIIKANAPAKLNSNSNPKTNLTEAAADPLRSAQSPANALPASPRVGVSDKRITVVTSQLLRAGTVLTADMLRLVDVPALGVDSQLVSSFKDVEGGELVRDITAGTPIRASDVRRALMVKMGQSVMLTVSQGSGFAITARVEALQDGRMGEQVRLKNPESGRILSGIVTGPNTAKGI